MKRLIDENRKLNSNTFGDGYWLFAKDYKIHRTAVPINNIFWERSSFVDDRVLSMDKFKFVEYNEYINNKVFPFKKEY